MNTRVLTFSNARASLKSVMDQVWEESTPITITRVSGKNVVMVSEDDYNGMVETVYLLGSPKNAERLMESIAQFESGNTFTKGAIDGAKERSKKRPAKRTHRRVDS